MNENKITQNQYMFIVISAMIGIGVLSLPSGLSKIAHQQGWISLFIGGLYPLFIVTTASIIDNRTNHSSFRKINNMIYGKILSHIFIFIFFLYFLTIYVSVIAGYANVLKLTITPFLPLPYLIVPTMLLITLISICGIQMVGRICELYFYLITIILIIIPLAFITKGSIVNIKPIYSSFNEILKAAPESMYSFTGCEICYLIISNIFNKRNTKKTGVIASLITIFIYVYSVFMVIYYLGWELTSNLEYPLLYLIQTMSIPIISNFTAIFLFLWSLIILRTLICESFSVSYLLSIFLKIDYKKASFVFLPIAMVYIFFMIPEYNRKMILNIMIPYFTIFSFLWGLITTILVFIKFRGEQK